MLIIMSHGQATVERGFSVNGKLLSENLHTESLIAQRHIHDHMRSYDLQADDLDITHELLDSGSSARKCYFQSQKERSLVKEKSSKDCQQAELNEEILKLNTKATLLKLTIQTFKKVQTRHCWMHRKNSFSEMRNEIMKANALKRAATEKEEELDKTLAKIKVFIEKKIRYK